MAQTIRVEIEGGEELLRALERQGVAVGQVLEAAALAGGEVIAQAANGMAPEPSIEAQVVKAEDGKVEVDVGPPEKKWFWRFLEFGATEHEIKGNPLAFEGDEGLVITGAVRHPGMAARPFLRPAFDGKKDQATDAVGEALRKAIE